MRRVVDRLRRHKGLAYPGRRTRLILLILAAFTVVGTSAWAYWTTYGAGTASVSTGNLNAPSGVTVASTNNTGSVPVSWTGSSGTPVPQGYYLTRVKLSDSTTSPACGSSPTSLITVGASCTDSSVPNGTFKYTVTAVYNTWTTTSGSSINITVSVPTQLAFTTSPSSTGTSATALPTQPVVAVQDVSGNTVVTDTSSVTLALTTPAGATLACTPNPRGAVAGVVTFTGCQIDNVGTYTLTATDGLLTPATSSSVTITAGAASTLAVTTSPSSSTGGVAFASQPVVTVQDAGGNTVTTSVASVTLTITTPAGAALTCTANPKNAVAGVATFAGCSISLKTGTYTLTAASAGLANAVSTSFTISVGPATQLAFTTSPSASTAVNTSFAAQPAVTIQDAGGNKVTTSVASVTLTITTPAGAALTCTANPKNAVAGVDTFAACKIDTAGIYTLTAASSGLTNAVSASLTVFGPATQLAFTTSPSASTAVNTSFAAQPAVTIQDAGGNKVTTSVASVTLTITTPAGATLTCTANPKNAAAGVDTFATCKINKVGTYTLTATSGTLTAAASNTFTITAGPATKLAFTTSPSSSTGGTAFGTQPAVTVQDAGGNTVTTNTASITLTITTPAGAALACAANPTNAVTGVATFTGCSISLKTGTYTLTAASTGLTNAVSTSFTITVGPATKLAFTTSPSSSTTHNVAFATQPVVTVQDAGGNTVTTSTASITLTITTPAGATLACTTNPKAAVAGVDTFAGCKIDTAGTYTLTATASGLSAATSNSFTIT
jgi:trimeric autotransporter adhesin